MDKIYGQEGIENKHLTEEFRRILLLEISEIFIFSCKDAITDENFYLPITNILGLSA